MATNTLKTRIQLKYDSLENWASKNPTLLSGELAIVSLPPKGAGVAPDAIASGVLFKVGPGAFNDLPWASALAADVHEWAKKSQTDFITWVNTVVEHPAAPDLTPYLVAGDVVTGSADGTIAIRGTDVKVKGLGSAAYTDSSAYAPADIDTGVHSVALAGGTNNGTLKLTVDGTATDNIAVTGLGSAAYTASTAYATAEQGAKADSAVQKVTVLGQDLSDGDTLTADQAKTALGLKSAAYTESTAYATSAENGAKAAADAAQGTADEALEKIDTFLASVTPDGSDDIIDTLAEINSYIGEHGQEFAALSGKVTAIENGTTTVPKAADADTLDGHDSTYFEVAGTAQSLINDLDVTIAGMGAGKTIATLTETDGKIAATFQDISITESQISDLQDYALKSEIPEIPQGTGTATIASAADGVVTLKSTATLSGHTLANGAGADITLAKIATTGNVNDLIQTTGDYLIFNCGSSTEVI